MKYIPESKNYSDVEITRMSTNPRLTKSDVRHIRNRETYKDITCKYF